MSLIVGIPKEQKPGERRVSLTPKGIRYLCERGIAVYVEENAGLHSGFSNDDYQNAGGILVPDAKNLWNKAQLIKKIKEPIQQEFNFFTSRHLIFAYLHLASPSAKPLLLALQKAKATAVAYETIQKGQDTPLLRPMSEVAGTLAAYYGAIFQTRIQIAGGEIKGMQAAKSFMFEAASKYPAVPSFRYRGKLVVLGGGHVGRHGAQMAAQMGADVWVSEISEIRRKELAVTYGNNSINIMNPNETETYHRCLNEADVIIGAVHSPGKRAPLVIDKDLLKKISCEKKKIILDVSIDQGGNIAESIPGDYETPLHLDSFGNLRFSVTNIPSLCGQGASNALEAASLAYTFQLTQGLDRAIQMSPELKSGINVLSGEIVNSAVSEAHGF